MSVTKRQQWEQAVGRGKTVSPALNTSAKSETKAKGTWRTVTWQRDNPSLAFKRQVWKPPSWDPKSRPPQPERGDSRRAGDWTPSHTHAEGLGRGRREKREEI